MQQHDPLAQRPLPGQSPALNAGWDHTFRLAEVSGGETGAFGACESDEVHPPRTLMLSLESGSGSDRKSVV